MNIKSIIDGDCRTVKVKKNILYSIGVKGVDALTQFMIIPLTLGYLNPYEYGIWLTLNSVLVWINSFDIGLGNGLRNQLAEAVAEDNMLQARSLVSTAFGMITIIMIAIFSIGSILILNCNWYTFLNANPATVPNLLMVVYVSFALFCLNFMLKFIGNIYLAMQMPAVNNLLVSLGHILSLIIIWILTLTTDGSLLKVAFTFSLSPVIVYIIAYPVTFSCVYKQLAPTLKLFDKKYLQSLFNVGILFFMLQISGVILFATSNVILSKLFGPESVTSYNITQRYFSIVNMLMAIVLSPMWSAVTDAYAKGEIDWIRLSLKKIDRALVAFAIMIILMLAVSPFIYKIWIGTGIEISFLLSFLMGLYTLIIISSTAYSYILNGLGKLRIQTITTLGVALLFIPVTVTLGKICGIYGIILGMCLLNLCGTVLNRIQVRVILNGQAKGWWNK